MFNMLGRTAIIALRFEYFTGGVIHAYIYTQTRAYWHKYERQYVHGFAPVFVATASARVLILHFGLRETSLDSRCSIC